jgi:hypothetical protein
MRLPQWSVSSLMFLQKWDAPVVDLLEKKLLALRLAASLIDLAQVATN